MKNLFISIVIILIGLTSCQKSLKQIIKEAENATFIIYTYDEFGSPAGSGSGFFIAADGTGITNYHVLDGAVKAVVKTADEKKYEIDCVILSDKKWDVVKFRIKADNPKFEYLTFSKKEVVKGDMVYNISSPMGLEKTVSDGIVSALRDDKQHGDVIQISAPISSGSSGSPILDKNGDVIAVATYVRRGGQNLNFGVKINDEKLLLLTKNDFEKANKKFNSKSDFVILNIPSDKGTDIVLNAIEFDDKATTLYLSYTHLNLWSTESHFIWCELNKKDEDFTLVDNDRNQDYYVNSSTVGADKAHGTKIDMATTLKFKVFLPAIKNKLTNISVYGCGKNDGRWTFKDIDLDKYRETVNVNFEDYKRDYALASLTEGEVADSREILSEIVEENPEDVLALNTLGIISHVVDNNTDALYYFGEAIENAPNDEMAYINRAAVYNHQKNYEKALEDLNKAVSVNPDQPDNYWYRAQIYFTQEDYEKAKADIDKMIESDDFKTDETVYLYRIYANVHLANWKDACKDIYTAFQLTNDKETEEELQDIWKRCGCK
jgi:serine protease Do